MQTASSSASPDLADLTNRPNYSHLHSPVNIDTVAITPLLHGTSGETPDCCGLTRSLLQGTSVSESEQSRRKWRRGLTADLPPFLAALGRRATLCQAGQTFLSAPLWSEVRLGMLMRRFVADDDRLAVDIEVHRVAVPPLAIGVYLGLTGRRFAVRFRLPVAEKPGHETGQIIEK
jgi:hypothetical protein